jgi:hypothetical protein
VPAQQRPRRSERDRGWPEAARGDDVERAIEVAVRHTEVGRHDPDTVGETKAMHQPGEVVGPRRPAVDQGHRCRRQVDGQDQPGDTATGTDVGDLRRRVGTPGAHGLDEVARVGDHRRNRLIAQKTEALG